MYHCPICDLSFDSFAPFGKGRRPNVACPECGSAERHRLLYLFLKTRESFFRERISLLHVAAENCFYAKFREQANIQPYVPMDLSGKRSHLIANLESLPFPDASFDFILCSHVLEHVNDDRKAMSDIRRVLKPGGIAILDVPLSGKPKTEEDRSLTPAERRKRYGREEHLRSYGTDYAQRLEAAGFKVQVNRFANNFTQAEKDRFVLEPSLPIFLCSRA